MDEAQAIYTVIIGVGALLAVMAPVIKLNNSITKLTTTIEFLNADNKRQDDRLDAHSKTLDDHEKRISHLEG